MQTNRLDSVDPRSGAVSTAIDESWENTYWARTFGVSEPQLRAAVAAVGTNADDVHDHLRNSLSDEAAARR